MQYAVGYRTAEGEFYVYVCIGFYDVDPSDLERKVREVLAVDFGLRNPNLDIFYIARRQYA